VLDRAISDGLIAAEGRATLARRILALIDEGYLTADLADFDQASPEQELTSASTIELTMKAMRSDPSPASSQTIQVMGSIVNSQVATGDITTFTVFVELLEHAEREIDALDGVDEQTRQEAKGLLQRMRGTASAATGMVITGAAGQLVAQVIAQLTGLPFS
jgi:hypothetical protein